MSVDRTDHIVYGWKLPYDFKTPNGESIDLWDDKFLPMIEGHPGEDFTIISDGVIGKYSAFGINIASSPEQGWGFLRIEAVDSDKLFVAIRKFIETFGFEPSEPPHLFIFSHFS